MNSRVLVYIICMTFLSFGLQGQNSQNGVHLYAGLVRSTSKDVNVTKNGEAHYGNTFGALARLNSDYMYFLVGGEWCRISTMSKSSPAFFSNTDMNILKGRIGLGFDLYHFSRNTYLRTKLLGSFDIINSHKDSITVAGYEHINDGIGGLTTGLGLTLGMFMIDLEYEYGVFNLYTERKDSKLNTISLTAGIRF